MKLRSLGELTTALQRDLGWRRKELVLYRGMLAGVVGDKKEALLRGAVAVLYAHWEGSIKAFSRVYLDYVRHRRLLLGELATCFMAMAARRQLHAISQSRKPAVHAEFINWFFSGLASRARLPKGEVVRTYSNLSVSVFRDLVALIGLEYRSEYAIAEKPIIERLLKLRNDVAHGAWQKIDEAEFEQLYTEIDKLMVLFCDDVVTAAALSAFRRSSALTVS